jgi:hypothetical protein
MTPKQRSSAELLYSRLSEYAYGKNTNYPPAGDLSDTELLDALFEAHRGSSVWTAMHAAAKWWKVIDLAKDEFWQEQMGR